MPTTRRIFPQRSLYYHDGYVSRVPSSKELFVLPLLNELGAGAEEYQISVDEAEALMEEDETLDPRFHEEALAHDKSSEEIAAEKLAGVSGSFEYVCRDYKLKLRRAKRKGYSKNALVDMSTKYMRCVTVCAAMRRQFPEEKECIDSVIKACFRY